ncbi:MAG: T9SS type A sorting domain-containing protein [Rhodothermales bacterium]|nr:T9SS type A sorting domain-containing protein [Rhodothermales bacterium]
MRKLLPLLTFMFGCLLCVSNGYAQPQELVDQFESREHTADGFTIPYRLFIPSPLNPAVQYPLILTLHGSGQRGSDNENQIATNRVATTWVETSAQSANPAFVVSPQAPTNGTWSIGSGDPEVIGVELATTMDLLDSLASEFNIDLDRVYVTGLSMGGIGTFEAVFHDPERFAAAIPMSGGYVPSALSRFGDVPFFVFHGKKDTAVPWVFSTQMVSAFEETGRTAVYTDCGPFQCSEMSVAELDSALATRPNLVFVSHPNDGHVIWEESYDSRGLHAWLFDQHRLVPDAIQFNAPTGYPTWSGTSTIEWTAPNPGDRVEVWFSPDHGQTWNLVDSGIPNTGSYAFDTQAFGDTPFGLLRIMLVGPDGLVYARQRSTPFQIDNGSSGTPIVQLQDFPFRDRVIPPGAPEDFVDGLLVTDTTLTLRFRAGDIDSPSLDVALFYSSDGGATFETIDTFSHETSGDLRSVIVDMTSLPNAPESQIRLDVSDGAATVSSTTPIFSKQTPRNSSSYIEQVVGNGRPVISINFVAPDLLTNHRYRVDFSVTESESTVRGKSTAELKTYAVTDLDLGVQIFSGFPVSLRESPVFDGIRLSIQDAPDGVDTDQTRWITGDTDMPMTIASQSPSFGALLATPNDYRITITEGVADTSKALFGFSARLMRFTVENVTAGEPRDVIFLDRGDGTLGFSDRLYLLEEDDAGELALAWFLTVGTPTVAPEPGDVFEMVTHKPLSDGDSFEFVGAIGVAVEEDGMPDDFRLGHNYPNPFSRSTTIPYHLASTADVELTIFDAIGRRVAVLVDEQQSGGSHTVTWDTTLMPSGAYFSRLKAGGFQQTRTLLLLK